MGKIIDAVFGGSATDAADAQVDATRQAMEDYKQGVREAKREIKPRFAEAEESRLMRYQQAMDAMGRGFQPQMDTMSQGNMNAQQLLAGSAPQMQNAILGGPVDYSFMQPQGVNFNASDFLGGAPTLYDPEAEEEDDDTPANNGMPYRGDRGSVGLYGPVRGGGRSPAFRHGRNMFNRR